MADAGAGTQVTRSREPLLGIADTLLDPIPVLDLARDLGPDVAPVIRAYWEGKPAVELEWRFEDLLRGWGIALDDGAANRPRASAFSIVTAENQ